MFQTTNQIQLEPNKLNFVEPKGSITHLEKNVIVVNLIVAT